MTKHTERAGKTPNGSIDFDKVQAAAKAGKDDIYKGAVSHDTRDAKTFPKRNRPDPEEVAAAASVTTAPEGVAE
jgi:hypothetical protein